MKRFISLIVVACFGLMMAQDAAGTYRLTGTNVRYTSLLRQTSTVYAHEASGFTGIAIPLATFPINAPAGQLINGPFNEDNLHLSGALLNVTFESDGTGTINEGSHYPSLSLDLDECLTTGAALPITDDLVYTSNLTPSNYVQSKTMLGEKSLSPLAAHQGFTDGTLCFPDDFGNYGTTTYDEYGNATVHCTPDSFGPGVAGGISLSQSAELDFFTFGQDAGSLYGACAAGFYYPATPCCFNGADDSDNCGTDADGNLDGSPGACGDAIPYGYECQPGNDCDFYEACASAGYISKGHDFETIQGNGTRDMYVEWHAIDGGLSGSGYGEDELDPCEDGLCVANALSPDCTEADGSVSPACTAGLEDYDRILGVPGLPSTIMNEDCGYGEFIVGGSDEVGAGLAAGVAAACESGMQGDATGGGDDGLEPNGYPDVFDGCQALEGAGYDGATAATMAFIGACQALGFDELTCTGLAGLAEAAVTSQTVCYEYGIGGDGNADGDDELHESFPVPEGGCPEATVEGALWMETPVPWDCYGLYALTFQSAELCGAASGAWLDLCVLGDGLSRTFNVLNADLAPWGGFFTWNAANYSGCAAAYGADFNPAIHCLQFAWADSDHQFDSACLADQATCSGRLLMEMNPTCVPELQVREVYIDFDEIDTSCGTGDWTLDGTVNILDVVQLVQGILSGDNPTPDELCGGDINGDGILSILDYSSYSKYLR